MSWYDKEKAYRDKTAVSSRIRLARNIAGIPFPSKMNAEQIKQVNEAVKKAVSDSNLPIAKGLKFINMDDVPENERYCMVERHLISPEFAASCKGKAIVLNDDETLCIMLCEEDHIRIQVLLAGLQLDKAYEIASLADDMLCSSLKIAYDKRLGFLTECPTNLGTGMRASVMLHLPLLNESGELKSFADSASKIGYTVRGLYGEGSKATVSLYQISNQVTLGLDEKSAVENLKIIADKLSACEKEIAGKIGKDKLIDISMRAFGTLKYARILSSTEMMKLISQVCIGLSAGAIKGNFEPLKLFIEGQPHTIIKKYGEEEPILRDKCRAEMVRELLGKEDLYEV